MRLFLLLVVSLCVLDLSVAQNNRKKFGSNAKPNPDYDPPAEDYEGDALYYEDYDENGAKKDKDATAKDDKPALANKEKTDKPALVTSRPSAAKDRPSASKDDSAKDHKESHPSLFAPRRNRTPFAPRPVDRPKPTLPSFIKKPVDPASITTPRTPPNRVATFSATTAKTSSVIRATTSRPSRFKNGPGGAVGGGNDNNRRDRTTTAPATSEDRGRRFGSSVSRANAKPLRGNFRAPPSTEN